MKFVVVLLVALTSAADFKLDGGNVTSRKHYGLNFNDRCHSYSKVFKCMSVCKSIGFQIFRLNFKCKCSCHELKTTTILPFFKWRTNGTTLSVPQTNSPRLWEVVGTLSPKITTPTTTTIGPTNFTCPPWPDWITADRNGSSADGDDANGTTTSGDGDSTTAGGEGGGDTTEETTPEDGGGR